MVEVSEKLKNQIREELKYSYAKDMKWIMDSKLQAKERILKDGLPDKNIEEWKFSENLGLFRKDWVLSKNKTTKVNQYFENFTNQDLIFQNGNILKEISNNLIKQGITFKFLSEIVSEESDFLKDNIFLPNKFPEKRISKIEDTRSQTLTNLNTLLTKDNSIITFDKSCKLDRPLKILFDFEESKESLLFNTRSTIIVEENVNAEVIQNFTGGNENTWSNFVTDVYLKEGAKLLLTRIHDNHSKSFNTSHLYADLKKNSKMSVVSIASSNKFFREEFRVNLSENSSECSLDGVLLTDNQNFGEVFSKVVHKEINTKSCQRWRTVASDKSQTAVQGRIRVEPLADGTDAKFSSKSLLLGNKSKTHAKPELEILADAVMCSHGSTVGQLDSDALFYLRSRGINFSDAKKILVEAFINELFDDVQMSSEAVNKIYSILKKFNL